MNERFVGTSQCVREKECSAPASATDVMTPGAARFGKKADGWPNTSEAPTASYAKRPSSQNWKVWRDSATGAWQRHSSSWRLPCEPSGAIRSHQAQLGAIRRNQAQSGAISSHQVQDGAIRSPLGAIRRHQRHARTHRPPVERDRTARRGYPSPVMQGAFVVVSGRPFGGPERPDDGGNQA